MEKLADINWGEVNLTGLFGYPVEHSLSPAMHNAGFKELGLDYLYLPFAVNPEDLAEAAAGIKGLNLRGVNVTIPHKQSIIASLDELSKEAELIGAVNTVVNEGGKLIGYNTDGQGYLRMLKEEAGFKPDNKKVLVIGAGGAARAVAFQLALAGISELYITNRTFEKAEELAGEINDKLDLKRVKAFELKDKILAEIIDGVNLLVDTTPVGMHPDTDVEPVVGPELLHKDLIVSDLVYNPRETVLLKAAKKAGAEPIGGLGMLLYQGVIAFELWTGEEAPVEVMRERLESSV